MYNAFDLTLDEVEVIDEELTARPKAPKKQKAKRKTCMNGDFGMVPLELAKELGGPSCVITHLAHYAVMFGGEPVPATALYTGCKDSKCRHEHLLKLERLGAIELGRRGKGKVWFATVKYLNLTG